jgi:hypothetical protein
MGSSDRLPADDLTLMLGMDRFAGGQEVDGLQQIGLALGVLALEQGQPAVEIEFELADSCDSGSATDGTGSWTKFTLGAILGVILSSPGRAGFCREPGDEQIDLCVRIGAGLHGKVGVSRLSMIASSSSKV